MKEKGETTVEANIKKLIIRAEGANQRELKAIREDLIGNLERIGAKTFVDTTASLLEEEFEIKGCNDPRIPLKRIFTISLPELEKALSRKEFDLPQSHPILGLFREHKSDVEQLKAIEKELGVGDEEVITKLKDYYKDLDIHILKEEQALFPNLEEKGMGEHPDNLREEHDEFTEDLSSLIKLVQSGNNEDTQVAEEKFNGDFIPAMSNHMFRESFIFYPAALQYIQDDSEWALIERGFDAIDDLVQ
ncbi:MAG: hemerythrin domain-containing protein [Candidatus Bipolaricaulia bacterium]